MSSSYWGDLPIIPDTDSGIAAIEREQMTKPRAMDVEGPRLHQPSSRHYPPSSECLPPDQFAIDPITKHTIQLIQCARKLRQLIQMALQHYETLRNSENVELIQQTTLTPAPKIPEYTGPKPKRMTRTFPFIAADETSDFCKGIGTPPPEIDDLTNRRLLRRSVAAIVAHAGFETCNESMLESLTDVGHEYYLKFMSLLRHAVDEEAQTGDTGFPDVMQRVFYEMKLGKVSCLHDFYQTRIINYHRVMMKQCEELAEEYERIKLPDHKQGPVSRVISLKEEPFSDIQFPVTDEADESNEDHLVELQGLVSLEEEQTGNSSLQQDVDTKWIKSEPNDTKVSTLDSFDENSEPPTPYDDIIQPSSTLSEIMSPPSVPPRKKKKRTS